MDDRSLSEDLSKLLSGAAEDAKHAPDGENTPEPKNLLVDSLKAIAGLSGGSLETAVSDFLNGGGELHETTRAAVSRGGGSAVSEVGSMLSKQFNLSPAIAKLVASLLVKLIPSLKEQAETEKTKPRRKPKKASSKKEASTKKKPKKKTTSKTTKKTSTAKTKPKKKTTTRKTAAKKKTTAKTTQKGTKAKKKAKKATRSETLDAP